MTKKALTISLCFAGMLVVSASAAFAADDVAKGKTVYDGIGACAGCHGAGGAGDGPAGSALTPKPSDLTAAAYKYDTDGDGKIGTEIDLFNIITEGAAKYGGSPLMVGRADIAEADRKALAKYVLSLKK